MKNKKSFILNEVKKLREEAMRFNNIDMRELTEINSKTIEIFEHISDKFTGIGEDVIKEITSDLDFIRKKYLLEPLESLDGFFKGIDRERPFIIKSF
ncbi:MAG: hypothetical protein ACFFDB_00170 [Promethearchaeota archaeon]